MVNILDLIQLTLTVSSTEHVGVADVLAVFVR